MTVCSGPKANSDGTPVYLDQMPPHSPLPTKQEQSIDILFECTGMFHVDFKQYWHALHSHSFNLIAIVA